MDDREQSRGRARAIIKTYGTLLLIGGGIFVVFEIIGYSMGRRGSHLWMFGSTWGFVGLMAMFVFVSGNAYISILGMESNKK